MATKKRAPAKGPQILNAEEYAKVKEQVRSLNQVLSAYEDAEEAAKFKLLIGTAWQYGPDKAIIITHMEPDGCLATLDVFDSSRTKRTKKQKADPFSINYPRIVVERGSKNYPPENEGAKEMEPVAFWQFYADIMLKLKAMRADASLEILSHAS